MAMYANIGGVNKLLAQTSAEAGGGVNVYLKGTNRVSYLIPSEYNHFVFTASVYSSPIGLAVAVGSGSSCTYGYTEITYKNSTLNVESQSGFVGVPDTGDHESSYILLNGSLSKADNGYYKFGWICFTADYISIYDGTTSNVTDLQIYKSSTYSGNHDIHLSISCYK